MFDDPAASNAVERVIGKRKLRQVAGDKAGAIAGQARSGPAKHLMRKIERHEPRLGMRAFNEVAENLPCARPNVEDALAARNVEFSAAKYAAHERLVQRHHTAEHEHGTGRPIVQMPDATAVLLQCSAVNPSKFY